MNRDADETYYFDERAKSQIPNQDPFGKGIGYVHKSGNETECNLSGLYVTMVADMSEEIGNDYDFSICSVGIFGT